MQYLLSRRLIASSGSLAPSVTPIVRVPPNGAELNQWFAKQALDLGAYGIVWPHISTVEEAYNAVAACRYPRLSDKPRFEPQGIRGDGPAAAVRYWGTSLQDYYRRADSWPLEPDGEILVMLMIEDTKGISNLREILRAVPGIGAVMIGEGDLSQELGYPRQYEHPAVLSAMAEIVAICREEGVVCGHPHVSPTNAQRVLDEGFRFLMVAPNRSHDDLERVQALSGKS
jgi:4-hydroxy-2-oxoheptanedioate aldolase